MKKDQEIEFLQKTSKYKVIDEDTYRNSIEKIIERDFFPDKKVTEAEIQLFKAIDTKDPQSIQEAKDKIEKIKKNISEFRSDSEKRNVPLDEFLEKYTSEDNASFELILQKMKEKHRERWREFFKEAPNRFNSDIKLLTNGPNDYVKLIKSSEPLNKNQLFFIQEKESIREDVNVKLPDKKINYENLKYVEPEYATTFQKKKEDYWSLNINPESLMMSSIETPEINGYKIIRSPPKNLENSFKIPELSSREKVAFDLSNQASENMKKTSSNKSSTPSRMQSPIQNILSKKRPNDFTQSLRSTYTPPIRTPTKTPTRTPTREIVPESKKVKKDTLNQDSITDGLLKF